MILRDYHVHTNLCDGKDSPEEVVISAIEKGFTALGFSGHNTLRDEYWCMSRENTEVYRKEVSRLKEKYRDKLEILCGIEQDYYSEPATGYDYIIGSVHCLKATDGSLIALDDTAQILKDAIDKHFGGDSLALAKEYFQTVSDVADKTGADIVGHFDLILKFEDKTPMFDSSHPEYIKAAIAAIDKLSEKNVLFEVNTGAMARGYRKVPYPEAHLLRYIREKGCDVVITGDCHDCRYLGDGFKEALALVKECGFTRVAHLTKSGISYTDI